MQIDVVTLFPGFFAGPLDFGVLRRARETGRVCVSTHDLRDFTHDRHRTVDDRPYGGGEGMVLKAEPIAEALASLSVGEKRDRNAEQQSVILLSAQGRPFTQATAIELSTIGHLVLVCGRYEGVDERVNELFCDREISIGDYVLSGGELAAAVLIDAVVRLLPGVLGNPDSARFESFTPHQGEVVRRQEEGGPPSSTHAPGGLLDYPHYTRPADFRGLSTPSALLGGDHDAVRRWRRRMSLGKTLRNRPDLLEQATLDAEDLRTLRELRAEQEDEPSR